MPLSSMAAESPFEDGNKFFKDIQESYQSKAVEGYVDLDEEARRMEEELREKEQLEEEVANTIEEVVIP